MGGGNRLEMVTYPMFCSVDADSNEANQCSSTQCLIFVIYQCIHSWRRRYELPFLKSKTAKTEIKETEKPVFDHTLYSAN